MATLITGGTGFLGSHLARHLVALEQLDDVVLFDRSPAEERIADVRDRLTVVAGDVLEIQELLAAMSTYDIDRVAHFAFMAGTAHPEKIVPYVRMTCMGTANVFEAARIHGVKRVVNASSMAVYGLSGQGERHEDDPARPISLYGSCKLWTEQLAGVYATEHGMEILSLRVCATMGIGRLGRASLGAGVMGPEMVHFMAAPELAALGHSVTMPPDHQLTEFLYAPDAAQACWLALTVERPPDSVFNLSAGRWRVGELTTELRRLLPEAEITVADQPEWPGPLLSTERVAAQLGFVARYSPATGIAAYIEAVRTYADASGATTPSPGSQRPSTGR